MTMRYCKFQPVFDHPNMNYDLQSISANLIIICYIPVILFIQYNYVSLLRHETWIAYSNHYHTRNNNACESYTLYIIIQSYFNYSVDKTYQ